MYTTRYMFYKILRLSQIYYMQNNLANNKDFLQFIKISFVLFQYDGNTDIFLLTYNDSIWFVTCCISLNVWKFNKIKT